MPPSMIPWAQLGLPARELLISNVLTGVGAPTAIAADPATFYVDVDPTPAEKYAYVNVGTFADSYFLPLALDAGRVDVRRFGDGAKGDGVTDDTDAVLAALAFIEADGDHGTQRRMLYFPAGNFRVRRTILNSVGFVKMVGEGLDISTITFDPDPADYPTVAITHAVRDAATWRTTITTSTAHGFTNGQMVAIAGTGLANANGIPLDRLWPVTVTGTTTFTVQIDSIGSATTGTAQAAAQLFRFCKGITSDLEENPNQGVADNDLVLFGPGIRDLSLRTSADSDGLPKVMVEAVDTASFVARDFMVRVDDGAGSIALRCAGRQATTIRNVDLTAPRPIVLGVNPNYAYITCDHMLIEAAELLVTDANGINLEIEDRSVISNLVIKRSSFVTGRYGLYFDDTRTDPVTGNAQVSGSYAYASINCVIDDVRMEQFTPGGWNVYWTANHQILQIKNGSAAVEGDNIYLRNIIGVHIDGHRYASTAGVALDVDFCRNVEGHGCYWNAGSTLRLGSHARIVYESQHTSDTYALGMSFRINHTSNATDEYYWHSRLEQPRLITGLRFVDTAPLIHSDVVSPAAVFTTEAATTTDNVNYKITNRQKARWQSGTVTVYKAGVAISPTGADPFGINYNTGAISFTGGAAVRAITFSGNYYPPAGWGARNLQDEYNTFYVDDDGKVTAYDHFIAPYFFASGGTGGVTLLAGQSTTVSTGIYVDGLTGYNRGLFVRSGSVNRAFFGLSSVVAPGTGTNAGDDLFLVYYKDDNTAVVALQWARATGRAVLVEKLSATGLLLRDAASTLIPGGTSFSVRDTSNTRDNLLVLEVGDVSVHRDLAIVRDVAVSRDLSVTRDVAIVGHATVGTYLAVTGAFGCNGTSPSGKVTLPADATDLATAEALANALKAGFAAFGFA